MQEYERQISLRTIYLTLLRRIEWIILIFVPIVLASFIVTNFIMTKTYRSSAAVSNNNAITTAQYQVMQTYINNEETLDEVATSLKEATPSVRHSNGSLITAKEIKSGMAFGTLATNSISVSFTFTSTDRSITKPVLQELTDTWVEKLKAAYMPNASVYSQAGDPVKASSENKYFLIAVAAGFVLACGIPFVYEIVADQVYDKKDITLLGAEGFELKASK